MILTLGGKAPVLGAGVFVAPNATLIGDIELGDGSSVWFGCVLRADIGTIRIGARTNIQDLSMAHMTHGLSNLEVGSDVTVGHGVILHGCRVEDRCLIGMGAILLDNAVIGAGSLVGAGALVPPRMVVPPGSLVLGNPAKVVRPVNAKEQMMIEAGTIHYVENAKRYVAALAPMSREAEAEAAGFEVP